MKNGEQVSQFEQSLASYCGARFAIAASSGTVTLQAALIALGVKPGDKVATTPLTMSATSIAILNVGAIPVYCDIDPDTWLLDHHTILDAPKVWLPVSLYGLHQGEYGSGVVDDAAQTLRKHNGAAFMSLSFQASKILNLGEGGALLTDDEELAEKARSYLSLGYRMSATQARINPATLKDPSFERHHSYPAINGRLNDVTAMAGLHAFDQMELPLTMEDGADAYIIYPNGLDGLREIRRRCAALYRQAIQGCPWITPQAIPDGFVHDMWTFAIALHDKALWHPFTDRIVNHGGERPFGAWRLTFDEPVFRHLDPGPGSCPIARDLQPRLVQSQTNSLESAERNAEAWYKAIQEIGG